MGSEARVASAFLLCAAVLACRAVHEPVLPEAWPAELSERPLSHADCVELALASAPNAAAWRARLDAARAALAQAQTLPNPLFAVGWEDLSLGSDLERPLATTFSLSMALRDVLQRKGRAAAASHDLAAEEAALLAERRRLTAEVQAAYDTLVAARARAALEDERTELARSEREALQRFVEAGFSARIDVERSEAALAEAELARAHAQAEARASELALAFALGFERPVPLALSEPLSADSELETRDLEALLTLAAAHHPELTAARERYAAELERLHLEASALRFLPTVEVGTHTEQGGGTGGTAGLEVALPLFDTGASARSAEEAALLARAAELRRVARDVGSSVALALEQLSATRVELEQHARPLAERRRRLREETVALFTAGELPYVEVLAARRDEVEARRGALEAERALASARVDLALAVGTDADPGVTGR